VEAVLNIMKEHIESAKAKVQLHIYTTWSARLTIVHCPRRGEFGNGI
jgi:hypothetical protein